MLPSRLFLVLGLLALPSYTQNARTSTLVDTSTATTANAPGVATDGNLSAIIYNADGKVYAVVSDAKGITWSTPIEIDNDLTDAAKFNGFQNGAPTTYVSRSSIYTTWRDDRNSAEDDVVFNRSTDAGVTWETDRVLDKGVPINANNVRDWAMAVVPDATDSSLDKIYVLIGVENDANGANEDIFLTISTDGGATFGAAISMSTMNGLGFDVDEISVSANGNNLYVAWVDNRNGADDLFFRSSKDCGVTFGMEILLDTITGAGVGDVAEDFRIASSGTNVLVTWVEELTGSGSDDLHVTASADCGRTFTADFILGGYTQLVDDCDNVTAQVAGGNLIVCWEDDRSGGDEIYSAVSTDVGLTWSSDTQITAAGGGFPRLSRDGGPVVLTYGSGAFPNTAEANYSLDNGVTWSASVTASTTTGDADFVEVAYNASLQNVICAWESDDTGGDRIYAGGFSVCGPAANSFRNSGTNPASYTVTAQAIVGGTFTADVDLSTSGHGFAVLVGFLSTANSLLPGGQTLLVNALDPTGELLASPLVAGPLASFVLAVPNDPAICSFAIATQAVHIGGVTPFALSNAQDLTTGGF